MESILLNEKKFTDFEAYAENMLKWDLDFMQRSSGRFSGHFKQVILPNVIIQKYSVSKGLIIKGTAPKGFSNFSILLKGESMPIWRGKEFTDDSIALFPENAELEGITPDGFETIEFAVSNNYMERIRRYLGLKKEDINLFPDKVYQGNRRLLNQLKTVLIEGTCNVFEHSDKLVNKNYINYLEQRAVSSLLNLFSVSVSERDYKQTSKRRNALNIIEDITNNLKLDHLSVSDLCEKSNVSLRTLEYAFQEKYNMTPKQYLRTKKLNNVRKVLIKSDPVDANIADIANKFGFWHMGQFAKDYKIMFGELPSKTLSQK